MSTDEKQYWEPVLTDEAWCSRIREDYPEKAKWSNEELIAYFGKGRKYAVLWDHLGDAYSDFEPLADAYLALKEKYENNKPRE